MTAGTTVTASANEQGVGGTPPSGLGSSEPHRVRHPIRALRALMAKGSRLWLVGVGLTLADNELASAEQHALDRLTDAEASWLWSSARLPIWRFAAYYSFVVWLLLLLAVASTFTKLQSDEQHGELYAAVAVIVGLVFGLSLIVSNRWVQLVTWLGLRLGDPLDQVAYALKGIGSTGMDSKLVGLERRRRYIRDLRHLDRAAERARLDPHGTGPMWSALNDGDDLLPEVRAYARDLVRGGLVRVERAPTRRALPAWLLTVGTTAIGAATTALAIGLKDWIGTLLPGG